SASRFLSGFMASLLVSLADNRLMGSATTKWLRIGAVSLDQFELARPPLFGEEWFERTVEAKQRVPTLARDGLDPVAVIHACGFGRAEIHSGRVVGARDRGRRRIALAARPGI